MSDADSILASLDALLAKVHAADDPELLRAISARVQAAVGAAERAPDRPAEGEDGDDDDWHGLVGRCPALLTIRAQAQKYADAPVPLLIRGESGTGKDVLANILHRIGPRAAQAFVSENCAAIPENLLESVLFGHKKGAFTGAFRDHGGHFVAADKGTLFLDEIGDMPLAMQAKLLRVLQEGEVRPVGGTAVRKVDVRIIAATNQDLEAMVATGTFREDLYYRLNVLQIELPPLRERGDDVLRIARRFLASATAASGRPLTFAPDAERALLAARWRGNVRQLHNEVQRVAVLASGPQVTAADFSAEIV